MATDEQAFAALAVGLSEDSKAERKKRGKAKDDNPAGLSDFTLDETHREELGFAMATKDVAQREIETEAFWRAAGNRMGFRHMTIQPSSDVLITGAFRALAIEADTGTDGVDLSEGAHTLAMDRMENLASEAVLDRKSLRQDIRDFLLDQIKARPKPWSGTSPAEQRDVAAACDHAADELVRKVVEALASAGAPIAIRALVTKVTLGDDIAINLKANPFEPGERSAAVVALDNAHGKHVMITMASKDDYSTERAAETDEEEPEIDFGAVEGPENDSDLNPDD